MNNNNEPNLAVLMAAVMDLHKIAFGPTVNPQNIPGKWTEIAFGNYVVYMNANPNPIQFSPGTNQPPQQLDAYEIAVYYNTWPVGLFSPGGGAFMAHAGMNHRVFAAAVAAAAGVGRPILEPSPNRREIV